MLIAGGAGLLDDLRVTVVLPAVAYVMFALLDRATPHAFFKHVFRRLSLAFVVLLFVFLLTATVSQDRSALVALWRRSPLVYSLAYVISTAGATVGVAALFYWRLRPSRWRPIADDERRLAEQYARYRAEKRRLYRLDGDPPPEDDTGSDERA